MHVRFKEARNSFSGIGVDLFKLIFRDGRLASITVILNHLFNLSTNFVGFGWFLKNSCYHSNGDTKHFILSNVDYFEI